jgi:hypothetical protein
MPFKRWSRYSPTSSQARVLVVQAYIAAYLQDLLLRFFFLRFTQREKMRKLLLMSYVQGQLFNMSSTKNSFLVQEKRLSQETRLVEVLAPTSLFLRGSHMQEQYRKRTTLRSKSSTIKGLLYSPDPEKCKKGMLSDQPRLTRITSMALLCCWGHSCSKIWHPSGLTLRCMPYGRGTLRIPLQRIS